MQLPPQLHQAIEQEIARCDMPSLSKAAAELSEKYRAQNAAKGAFIATEAHRLAYLAVRMPATFAAVRAVFAEIRRLIPEQRIDSVLDLGAGPGTVGWAAVESFDELRQITLVERDPGLIQIGKSLAQTGANAVLQNADWKQQDLSTAGPLPTSDLVVSAYALGEINPAIARNILQAAWSAARVAVVVIEPGTMVGFDRIRRFRDDLIGHGAHLVAPCPHRQTCPLPANDWCHFPQRLERSSLHRQLKGTLGYEDEKFAYIAAAKHPLVRPEARVIRHPNRHSGHAQLPLCTREGLQTITVTRKDKATWRRARKTDWGDAWPSP